LVDEKSTEQITEQIEQNDIYLPSINSVKPMVGATIKSVDKPTVKPTAKPTAKPKVKTKKSKPQEVVVRVERVKVSHYDPSLLGVNCSNVVNGICVSHMASGKSWEEWMDKAAACPFEWDFGTRFRLPDGRIFECQDRGGAIRYGSDGRTFVDLLTRDPGYKFGEVVEIEFLK
jgi:hypothetical protein